MKNWYKVTAKTNNDQVQFDICIDIKDEYKIRTCKEIAMNKLNTFEEPSLHFEEI